MNGGITLLPLSYYNIVLLWCYLALGSKLL